MDWLPQLLQTNDASFPSGSFAHSFGLEGLVQLGQVTDRDTFGDFIRHQIVPALEHFELPFVRLANEAARDWIDTAFFAGQPRCVVAMEACAGAHHWARELAALGHEPRLIPPPL